MIYNSFFCHILQFSSNGIFSLGFVLFLSQDLNVYIFKSFDISFIIFAFAFIFRKAFFPLQEQINLPLYFWYFFYVFNFIFKYLLFL